MRIRHMANRGSWSGSSLVLLLGAVCFGAFLRGYLLRDQILLDDEWHGLRFVFQKSFSEVLTSLNPYDNSSTPYNLYRLSLLKWLHWSEMTLRAPALLAGILTLLVLPLAVTRVVGTRAATFFAWLLAISPFLISYSRFARAYSSLALLGCLAILSGCRWLETGSRRHAVAYGVASTAAVFCHPAALAIIAVAPLTGLAWAVLQRWGAIRTQYEIGPAISAIIIVGTCVAIASAIVLIPLITHANELPVGREALGWAALMDAASMLTGTGSQWLVGLQLGLMIAGAYWLWRVRPIHAVVLAAATAAAVASLSVLKPQGVERAVVVLRYCIALVPLFLLLCAVSLDKLIGTLQVPVARACVGVSALLALLVVLGPLPEIYRGTNNFTGHSAFQGSYTRLDWNRSAAHHVYPAREVSARDIPKVYRWLATQTDVQCIVEYPFDIANYNNHFYFYQRFHSKAVIAGYAPHRAYLGHRLANPTGGRGSLGILSADQVISAWNEKSADILRFRNMVDVTSAEALAGSRANVVVLHKEIWALYILPSGYDHLRVLYTGVPRIAQELLAAGATQIMDDEELVAFRLPSP